MKLRFLMVGQLKTSPEKDLFQEYIGRLTAKPEIVEIGIRQDKPLEAAIYLKHLSAKDFIAILDERGENHSSAELAAELAKVAEHKRITFIIGGADGIPEEIKRLAKLKIAFGRNTWPHLMVRTMLAEQIYRAERIMAKHPYHRA